MKHKATHGSLLLRAAFLCALPLLSGCLVYPHRTVRSEEVKGTVLDAHTHAPIKGAKVMQSEDKHARRPVKRDVTTDASGRFVLPTSHNFHWAVSADADVPQRRYYELVKVHHPDYLAYEVEGLGGLWGRDELKVLLQPVGSLEISGQVLHSQTRLPIRGARVYFNDGNLECRSDGAGRFCLAATPAFYKEFRASEKSGQPFRDWVTVFYEHRSVTFHCGNRDDVREGSMLVQLGQ